MARLTEQEQQEVIRHLEAAKPLPEKYRLLLFEDQGQRCTAPQDISGLFFAYGIFRPGELAFFQIREFLQEVSNPAYATGSLRLRDGLPIFNLGGRNSVVKVPWWDDHILRMNT